MELTSEFTVDAPIEQAWAMLLDVQRIAPCMPGAALSSFDGEAFTGTVKVKIGPVNLTYAGKGHFVDRDSAAHRVVIQASGKDTRGSGAASATVTGTLEPDGTGTRVRVVTDLRISGTAAQFGRGMIGEVSGRLIGQFADCLASTIGAGQPAPVGAPAAGEAAPAPASETAPPSPPSPPSPREVVPVDLLAVSGISGKLRRALPYVLIILVAAAVTLAVILW